MIFRPIFALGLMLLEVLFPKVQPDRTLDAHLHAIWSGESYVYILTQPDSQRVVLFGSGSDAQALALREKLKTLGRSLEDVQCIFVFCGHATMTRGLKALEHVEVAASMQEAALVWGQRAPGASLQRLSVRLRGRAQSRARIEPIVPGQTLTFGADRVRVLAIAGHSENALAFAIHDTLLLGEGADTNTLTQRSMWPSYGFDEHPLPTHLQRLALKAQLDELDPDGTIKRIVDARHPITLLREQL